MKKDCLLQSQIDDKPLFFRRGLFFLAAEGCDRDIF
mgnify:CR=1 FL=1